MYTHCSGFQQKMKSVMQLIIKFNIKLKQSSQNNTILILLGILGERITLPHFKQCTVIYLQRTYFPHIMKQVVNNDLFKSISAHLGRSFPSLGIQAEVRLFQSNSCNGEGLLKPGDLNTTYILGLFYLFISKYLASAD